MGNNTFGFGSEMHSKLGQYTNQDVRAQGWAEKLLTNQDGMVTNATSGSLHYDDHRRMLDDVTMARKFGTTVFDSLSAIPGVRQSVSIFETVIGNQNMNEFNAQTSMNASNRKSQETDYQYNWAPQPIYHCDFHIKWRQEGFGSYKQGDGAAEATKVTMLERDSVLVNGDSSIAVSVNGVLSTLTGLTNSSETLQQAGVLTDWALEANKATVYGEAVDILATMFTTNIAGIEPDSVIMYVANDIWPQLEQVPVAGNSERTNLERLKALSSIKDVLPSQWLVDGSVLLVEASPFAIKIPFSTDITVAPWQKRDQMEDRRFTVFGASTIQVKGDRNGRSGVSYITKA
ncbi:hypothetical protein KAR91_72910 [Candidatus Pacearchaeota archaeon]|nr:hypothetical protein [Candidatus Pacearchaeota archaeon]